MWDVASGRCALTLAGHPAPVTAVRADADVIVSAGKDGTLRVYPRAVGHVQ